MTQQSWPGPGFRQNRPLTGMSIYYLVIKESPRTAQATNDNTNDASSPHVTSVASHAGHCETLEAPLYFILMAPTGAIRRVSLAPFCR